MGSVCLGLFFLLLVGPAIWLPSLLRWKFRSWTARVWGPALILGDEGARIFYLCLGGLVSLVGVGFIVSGVAGVIHQDRPRASHVPDLSSLPLTQPKHVISDMGLSGNALAFSPDGLSLLVGGGRQLQLVDVKSGTTVRAVNLPASNSLRSLPLQLFASSCDHQFVAVGLGSGSTTASRGEVGRVHWDDLDQFDLQPLPYSPNSLAISSSGRYVLAAPIFADDRTAVTDFCIVDFESDEDVFVPGEPPRVRQVAFRGPGDEAVLANDRANLVIYDVAARKIITIIEPDSQQPRGDCLGLTVSSDGQFAVTCHVNRGDQSLRLWDLQQRTCVYRREIPQSARLVALADGRAWFATSGRMDHTIGLWRRDSGKPFQILATPTPHGIGIDALAISPTDNIVAAHYEQRVFLWDIGAVE